MIYSNFDFFLLDEKKKYPVSYEESMNIVLIQELIRFNGLLQTIRESIVNVKKAMNGTIIMSNQLEEVLNSMLIGNKHKNKK